MDIVGQITTFSNRCTKRCGQLVKIIQSDNGNVHSKLTRLVTLCKTRSIERHEAIITAVELMPYIVESLETMTQWSHTETRNAARSLPATMRDFEFTVALHARADNGSL